VSGVAAEHHQAVSLALQRYAETHKTETFRRFNVNKNKKDLPCMLARVA
jgi:hypothetical protein